MTTKSLLTCFGIVAAAVLGACGGDDNDSDNDNNDDNTPSTTMTISGLVSVNSGSSASSHGGATVRVTIDRNNDGAIGAGEETSTTSDGDGAYTLTFGVNAGETVVLGVKDDGLAPFYRRIIASPGADIVMNATLKELEELECRGVSCALDNNALKLSGLPEDFGGDARVFNPVTESEAFPGDFADDAGNLLISGVFSTMAIEDDNGDEVSALDDAATMRMRMPQDTWGVIVDIDTTNSQIDVPLYYFDETAGTWVREGQGHLEDGDGQVIAPSTLASIKNGTYEGQVYAVGDVEHFSTWNIDWPVSTHGCITGRIVLDGQPATGATITARGVTYTGSSAGISVGTDGTFCIEAMRSESAGEDVDNDGATGETQKVAIRIVHQGTVYDLGEISMPTGNGTCGDGGCLDIGDLVISADKALQASICTYTGIVRDINGNAVASTSLFGYDETLDSEISDALCFNESTFEINCDWFSVRTDANGRYTIRVAVLDAATLFAMNSSNPSPQEARTIYGERLVRGCPSGDTNLTLDQGFVSVTPTITRSGNTISWTPSQYEGYYLFVSNTSSSTFYKWMISSEAGFASPVTYGTVPAAAEQAYPANNAAPAALVSGDQIDLGLSGTTADGYPYFGWASLVVP